MVALDVVEEKKRGGGEVEVRGFKYERWAGELIWKNSCVSAAAWSEYALGTDLLLVVSSLAWNQ